MLSHELVRQIETYLNNRMTLEELENLTVPMLPALIRDPESPEADLIAALEMGLAQLSDKLISEAEFRTMLQDALGAMASIWSTYPAGEAIQGSSSSQTEFDLSGKWSDEAVISLDWV